MLKIRKLAFRCKKNCSQISIYSHNNMMLLNGISRSYIETLYIKWLKNNNSVEEQWQSYFKSVNAGAFPDFAQPQTGDSRKNANKGDHGSVDFSTALISLF